MNVSVYAKAALFNGCLCYICEIPHVNFKIHILAIDFFINKRN